MHKKSRTGCKRCKTRKVKCDEERPSCGACKRHSLECIYLDPTPPAPRRDSAGSSASAPAPAPPSTVAQVTHLSSPAAGSSDSTTPGTGSSVTLPESDDGSQPVTEERRVLELRLMHRYMQSFSDIFAGIHNNTVAEIWRDSVPSMAIHHPFLLHALYAVTTLHVIVTKEHATQDAARPNAEPPGPRSIIPSLIPSAPPVTDDLDIEEMKQARRLYLDLAVRGQRMAVSNLNPDNADAICMATILISNQGFLLDHDLDLNETGYMPPVQWMLLAASINTVMAACRGMLGPTSAMERISISGRSLQLDRYNSLDTSKFFKPLMDFQPDTELADRDSYQAAINFLGAIRRGAEACEPVSLLSRRFFSFATLLPAQFLGFVRQQRPRALVIMACFFAMTKEVEGIWWFRGAASRHVEGLRTLVPADWSWAFEWIDDMAYADKPAKRRWALQREHMCAAPPIH